MVPQAVMQSHNALLIKNIQKEIILKKEVYENNQKDFINKIYKYGYCEDCGNYSLELIMDSDGLIKCMLCGEK